MQSIVEEKKCPKCGQTEKTKSKFHRGKQRYKCKFCGRKIIPKNSVDTCIMSNYKQLRTSLKVGRNLENITLKTKE